MARSVGKQFEDKRLQEENKRAASKKAEQED